MNLEKINAIEEYKQSVFNMLRCVSPVATHAQFHDAVNRVIIARAELIRLNIELSEASIFVKHTRPKPRKCGCGRELRRPSARMCGQCWTKVKNTSAYRRYLETNRQVKQV
jgi:hypothetical protein